MEIKNFSVRKLAPSESALAAKKWASAEFIQSGEYWLVTFEINGVQHHAGIQRGRRAEVSADIDQFEVQLNVRDEDFDNDTFIPEAQVADITRMVGEEWERGQYWK
jgi:hypothetical protein